MLHGAALVAVICRGIVGLTFACTLADQRMGTRQSVLNENCSGYKARMIIMELLFKFTPIRSNHDLRHCTSASLSLPFLATRAESSGDGDDG